MLQQGLLCRMLLLLTLIFLPLPAFASPQLAISSPDADGVFILNGAGLDEVSGLYVTISYDSSTLHSPRVNFGNLAAGKMSTVNTGNPIRIAVLAPSGMKGGGILATIKFERSGTSPGSITSLTAKMVDLQSRELAMAKPLVVNPSVRLPSNNGDGNGADSGADSGGDTRKTGAAISGTGRTPVLGGSVTLPGNAGEKEKKEEGSQPAQQENLERQARPAQVAPAPAVEGPGETQAPRTAQPSTPFPPRVQSVLERFRSFQGEKTASALSALFGSESGRYFTQSPPLLHSDGASTVTVAISNVPEEKAPSFTFTKATFVSLSHPYAGEWEIEVRPEKGALDCGVSLWLKGARQDFPIAVAPKADVDLTRSAQVAEADFILFLKEQGTPSAPKYDLNGDGKRDYLDDYIFTANYLLKLAEQEKKTAQQKGTGSAGASPP